MKFTEAQLESAIIELLEAEGYPHVLGEALGERSSSCVREGEKGKAGASPLPGVLIKEDLRTFLAKQYAADHITPQEIEAVINQLEAYSAADLYESNKAIMKLVCDGFLLKREDPTQKDLYIQLIDYSELVAFREPTPDQVPSIVAEDKAGNNALELRPPRISSRSSISWRSRATRNASPTAFSTSTACPWSSLNSRAPSARRPRFTTPTCS
jgi:type I restriction enzyme R subunit